MQPGPGRRDHTSTGTPPSGVWLEATAGILEHPAHRRNDLFDQQLLANWLDFANEAIDWYRLVDTINDKRVDT